MTPDAYYVHPTNPSAILCCVSCSFTRYDCHCTALGFDTTCVAACVRFCDLCHCFVCPTPQNRVQVLASYQLIACAVLLVWSAVSLFLSDKSKRYSANDTQLVIQFTLVMVRACMHVLWILRHCVTACVCVCVCDVCVCMAGVWQLWIGVVDVTVWCDGKWHRHRTTPCPVITGDSTQKGVCVRVCSHCCVCCRCDVLGVVVRQRHELEYPGQPHSPLMDSAKTLGMIQKLIKVCQCVRAVPCVRVFTSVCVCLCMSLRANKQNIPSACLVFQRTGMSLKL